MLLACDVLSMPFTQLKPHVLSCGLTCSFPFLKDGEGRGCWKEQHAVQRLVALKSAAASELVLSVFRHQTT